MKRIPLKPCFTPSTYKLRREVARHVWGKRDAPNRVRPYGVDMAKATKTAAVYIHDRFDFPRFVPAMMKIHHMASYTIHTAFPSGIVSGDRDRGEVRIGTPDEIRSAVDFQFRASRGCAVWAEDQDGLILIGKDPQGNTCSHELVKNLESIRAWHLANAVAK